MAVDMTGAIPLNAGGEVVLQVGVGANTVVGYSDSSQWPIDPATGKLVVNLPDLNALTLADLITGFVSGAGTVAATDTILQAFNKLDGNVALRALNLLTGFVSGAGVVAATDTVLQAINKLDGNVALKALNLLTGLSAAAGTVAATDTVLQGMDKVVGNYNSRTEQLLFVLRGADMQLNTDQALTKVFAGTKYRVTDIMVNHASGTATVACAGGIYDAAAKGGNALVGAGEDYVTLAAGVNVAPTITSVANTAVLDPTLYLSLSTGSTGACTADVFVYGYCVD